MSEHPEYTEGVCGDGAAILKDGQMMRIEDVVAELNRVSDLESRLEKAEAEREALIIARDMMGRKWEASRNDALTAAQDYLRRVPSFGNGKWAASHLEALKSPTPDQGDEA